MRTPAVGTEKVSPTMSGGAKIWSRQRWAGVPKFGADNDERDVPKFGADNDERDVSKFGADNDEHGDPNWERIMEPHAAQPILLECAESFTGFQ